MKKGHVVVMMGLIVACAGIMCISCSHIEKVQPPRESFEAELQEDLASTKKLLTVPIGCIHKNFIELRPGEIKETYYTLYTRGGGPGEVSYKIYSVASVYKKEEIPMPEGLDISIEPSKFIAKPQGEYTSKIKIEVSPKLSELFPPDLASHGGLAGKGYTFYLTVNFEGASETRGDDWLRVVVAPASVSVPGAAGLYLPHADLYDESLTLKPGGEKETYLTLFTGEEGPIWLNYSIYRIKGEEEYIPFPTPEEEKLPMAGLNVSIKPSKFLARTHEKYTSKIIVTANPGLGPGKYILRVEISSGSTAFTCRRLIINVVP
jgi:hypothetical protein